MSAAATAAGYLYASGRLRGRAAREQGEPERPQQEKPKPVRREKVRVAVYEREEKPAQPAAGPSAEPRRAPKIQYRTRRRWSAA
jgi:hypothetical protein